ncbi:MAG TPA: ferritin-like domain-containing protein [Bryobacteraceae bacterium]|nr:ferritin-like domain-containing protein [Bryobacteraceae bacterium]
MAKVSTLEELFLDQIMDLYDAEKQLTKALPKMAKASSSDELRQAFKDHLDQTRGHVERLEQVFEALGEKARGKKCVAMAGLVKEGDDVVDSTEQTAVRDAGLIAGAQKVEHYEIAGYGSVRAHARLLGHEKIASLLEKTLEEEKEADTKLNNIAQTVVNEKAASIGDTPERAQPSIKTGAAGGSRSKH